MSTKQPILLTESEPNRRSFSGFVSNDGFLRIVGWILLTLVATYTATQVTSAKVQAVEKWQQSHEQYQRDDDKNQITRPEFQQFTNDNDKRWDDLSKRLDRIEDKLDQKKSR